MNRTGKLICLLLVLCTFLCGCGETATTETTQAPAEETTEATTEAPTLPPVTSEETLQQALDTQAVVNIEGDITLTKTILMQNNLLDGGGFTLTGIPYVKDDDTTEDALLVSAGTVENLRITGAYRCIGDTSEHPVTHDIRVKNLYADSDKIAMSFSKGNKSASLFVEDCTLLGWTLVNKLRSVQFTNCTFGWNTNRSGGHFRAFVDSTLIGCRFEGMTKENGNYVPFNISFYSSTSGVTVTLEDCYAGDTLITAENVHELLKINSEENFVQVYNSNH